MTTETVFNLGASGVIVLFSPQGEAPPHTCLSMGTLSIREALNSDNKLIGYHLRRVDVTGGINRDLLTALVAHWGLPGRFITEELPAFSGEIDLRLSIVYGEQVADQPIIKATKIEHFFPFLIDALPKLAALPRSQSILIREEAGRATLHIHLRGQNVVYQTQDDPSYLILVAEHAALQRKYSEIRKIVDELTNRLTRALEWVQQLPHNSSLRHAFHHAYDLVRDRNP